MTTLEEPEFLRTRDSLADFVSAWERGSLPKVMWTHAAHVAVGSAYSVRLREGAVDAMRVGIRRYNEAVGTLNTETSGYHETLTLFWSAVLAAAVAGENDEWVAARKAVALYGSRRSLHADFYSWDVVRDTEARRTWIAPDKNVESFPRRAVGVS